jgi:Zn finger protein HypA/HybF involved in hydrogenase expression
MLSADNIDIFDFLDFTAECVHCHVLYDPNAYPIACPCCKKAITLRVLRESTVDSARVDYAAAEDINMS